MTVTTSIVTASGRRWPLGDRMTDVLVAVVCAALAWIILVADRGELDPATTGAGVIALAACAALGGRRSTRPTRRPSRTPRRQPA